MNSFYLCNTEVFDLKKSAAKVYSFLHMVKNNKTNGSFYKRSSIAKLCGLSESTVIRAIRELCQKGLLQVKKCYIENGRQTTNLYILVDEPQTTIPSKSATESADMPNVTLDSNPIKTDSTKPQKPIRFFPCSPTAFTMKLSSMELKIYQYLIFRAGKVQTCKPSKKEIATDCCTSLSTVFRAIRRLCSIGLIEVQKLTRKEKYGNNGTSVNLYVPKQSPILSPLPSWKFKLLLCSFILCLTPSLMSWVTPHITMSRTKAALKQRKEEYSFKLAKRYKVNVYPKYEATQHILAKRHFWSARDSCAYLQ